MDKIHKSNNSKTETEIPIYYCGKCSSEFTRGNKTETPRCPECGYRIIYKKRTQKPVSYKCV